MDKLEELKSFVVPRLYGHDKIKEALLLQLVEDLNILITGDDSTGKTTILESVRLIDGRYLPFQQVIHGDQIHGQSTLCIDDVPYLKSVEQAIFLDILSNNNKLLMVARPKRSRYDPFEPVLAQIGLPVNILNQFDLIFIMRDIPNRIKDESVLDLLFNEREDNRLVLFKHIERAKQYDPVLDDSAQEEIKEYYLTMRSKMDETGYISINYHIAKTLIKLTKAYAKLEFKDNADKEDAKKAISLIHFMISLVGIDPETGKIDINRIRETG